MPRTRLLLGGLLGIALLLALGLAVGAHSPDPPVGLSLLFQNGAMAPVTLAGAAPRYLQEIDLVAAVPGPVDRGIQPLVDGGELASLDWSGVRQVEEDWRPAGDGTFIRQRFYRQARWMAAPSRFQLVPTDESGRPVGLPLLAEAGTAGRPGPRDDFFVRRFVARQTTYGCRAEGDCAGAQKFVAEGLVQLRDALEPARRARAIPPQATRLALSWSAQPGMLRMVQVTHAAPADFPYGYGFEVTLEVIDPPADRHFYVPGDTVRFRVTFRDAAGRRLHPVGSLPAYGQFLRGEVPSGLRYYNGFALFPTTYYALKHREGLMAMSLLGPREPDAAIDIRVHAVHTRSERFAALGKITHCALCHLTPPAGPARGLLPSSQP
jgi:hypothetical protein